jgi:hypothetical protein
MIDFGNLVDMAIVGSIIGLMQVVKAMDTEQKMARFYPLFVMVMGVVAAATKTSPWSIQMFGYNSLLYVGASSFIYKFGKTTVLGK